MEILKINDCQCRSGGARFVIDLKYKGQLTKFWIETEEYNKVYFCTDRIDGIVVSLLPEILLLGEDVYSSLPMSAKLWYGLTKNLIPVLVNQSKGRFHNIQINCPTIEDTYSEYTRYAGTGMSFGIDSLCSYFTHCTESAIPDNYKVGVLAYINHGALNGQYTNTPGKMRNLFKTMSEKGKRFADRQGCKFISIDSNIDELYSLNYTKTHTFRTIGIVLMFQKLFNRYYYACGYGNAEDFRVDPFEDSAYYDLFTLPLLGTEGVTFYSDGIDKSRWDKTAMLAAYKDAQTELSVCWREMDNCSDCPKCIRTMTALELLGKLDDFGEVFDLKKYRKNYIWNWAKVLSLKNSDYFYREIAQKAKEMHYRLNWKIKFLAKCFELGRRIASPRILSRFQKILRR